MTKQTVLVTGGYGFIGSHIVEALVARGYKVHILDNLSTGKLENIASISSQDVKLWVGNVTDLSAVESAVQGCDYVFHEAAITSVPQSINDTVGTARVNYLGTVNVLEASRKHGVRRVIFASSAAVYGDEPSLPKNELMSATPITPYGIDKLASELIGYFYAQSFNLEFVCLRYFNVFGLRQDPSTPYSGVISKFCECMSQGIQPVIYGDGLQSRDFIHVSDVVQANLIAMTHPQAKNKTFNVGSGITSSILDIIHILNDLTSQNLQTLHKQPRLGDIRHSLADNTLLKSLGWSPTVSLRQGLAELLQLKESLQK